MAAAIQTLHESVTDWNSNTTAYAYDDAARMTSTTLPSGTGIVSSYVDGLGSTMAIVNASGNSQKSYTYDVYGEATPSGGLANEFDFAGQQTDGTGLQYLRARYYDPETGVFLSRERMAVGPNWLELSYRYAANNPVLLRDPTGLVHCGDAECGGGGGGGSGGSGGKPNVVTGKAPGGWEPILKGRAGVRSIKGALESDGYKIVGEEVRIKTRSETESLT